MSRSTPKPKPQSGIAPTAFMGKQKKQRPATAKSGVKANATKKGKRGDKLTVKQEKFARAYVECGNASEAYRRAYNAKRMKPETINNNAHVLLKNNEIATMVAKLQERALQRHDVTVDSITLELEEALQLAKKIEQPATMVAAALAKAKLHGLVVDRKELSGKDGAPIQFETNEADDLDAARRVAIMLHQAGRADRAVH